MRKCLCSASATKYSKSRIFITHNSLLLIIANTYQNHNTKRLELSKDFYNNGLNRTKQSKEKG
nr:hypothetical protein [Vibrio antiquarius]